MNAPLRGLVASVALAVSLTCGAQGFPSKPIRIIVPFSPGGTIDAMARTLQADLTKAFGQPVVVENKAGAGGRIGIAEVARSEPDGHTVVLVADGFAVDPIIYKDMPYDAWKDLTPVSLVARVPIVPVASQALPFDDIKGLVAYARQNPGKVTFGSVGIGSANHLTGELFSQKTGVTMLHVPYKGGANAQADLYSGNLDTFWGTAAFAKGPVASGKVKALGVASGKRSTIHPTVKTLAEQGFDGYEFYSWTGVLLPSATPPEIVARWHTELVKAARIPATAASISESGWEAVLSTPEEFRAYLRAEHDKWAQIIRIAKIPMQ